MDCISFYHDDLGEIVGLVVKFLHRVSLNQFMVVWSTLMSKTVLNVCRILKMTYKFSH